MLAWAVNSLKVRRDCTNPMWPYTTSAVLDYWEIYPISIYTLVN